MPADHPEEIKLDLLPPRSLNVPLWRSLLTNFRDRFIPEHLPPLELTSRPVDVGMLVGDIIDLPWYRTIFTNLGDVITPETLPPLELESRPVDIGELIGDQLQHPWWTSLLRNLADNISPERLPPLELTSAPVQPEMASNYLLVPSWSALLTTPKVFLPDAPRPALRVAPVRRAQPVAPEVARTVDILNHELAREKQRALRHAHLREALWVSIAALEVGFLVVWHFVLK